MKPIATPFRGVFPFLVTPTSDDGESLDEARLRSPIDEQIEAGVDGVTVFGSMGANGSFTEEERRRFVAVAVEHVAGTGSTTTAETIRMSRYAASKGVEAVLVVPITYWPLKAPEIEEDYTAIARAVDVPLGIYNNPTTTGTDIRPEQIARLARLDTVAFVKESSGIVERIVHIHRETDRAISVVNSKDAAMLEAGAVDADGWFSGGCNVVPRACVHLFGLMRAGDLAAARDSFMALQPLFAMQSQASTLRVVQTALNILGKPVGQPRRPLRCLAPEDRRALEQILIEVGALHVPLAKSA